VVRRRPELAVPKAELEWQPTIVYRKLVGLLIRLTAR
jgi:hypothetical protein